MPHSPGRSPNSAAAVATGVALASSHASAPAVGHTQSTPASSLTGKATAHERGESHAVFSALSSTDIGMPVALPSPPNSQPW